MKDLVSTIDIRGQGACGTSWFMDLQHTETPNSFHLESHCNVNDMNYPYTTEPTGSWYHWVITTSASGTLMYVNGSQVLSDATFANNTNVSNTEFIIGGIVGPDGSAPYVDGNAGFFSGKIDDIRIYNRAISETEIQALYTEIPLPSGKQSWFYESVETPVVSSDPAQAKPVGIGSVAAGGNTLSIQIGLNQFSGPVDIYGAFTVSADPLHVNILNPNGTSFTSFTISNIMNALSTGIRPAGADPWRTNINGPINEHLFDMPVSSIPAGSYTVYLLATPAGNLNSYYLWITSFTILPVKTPSNLTTTAISTAQINLSWTDNSTNEELFEIERKVDEGGTYSQIATVGADITTYSDTGLTPNTTYYYRARAHSASLGYSGYSNEASATTQDGGGTPTVKVYVDGETNLYAVYGGNIVPNNDNVWAIKENPEEYSFILLGTTKVTEEFNGPYYYYLIKPAEAKPVSIDALQLLGSGKYYSGTFCCLPPEQYSGAYSSNLQDMENLNGPPDGKSAQLSGFFFFPGNGWYSP